MSKYLLVSDTLYLKITYYIYIAFIFFVLHEHFSIEFDGDGLKSINLPLVFEIFANAKNVFILECMLYLSFWVTFARSIHCFYSSNSVLPKLLGGNSPARERLVPVPRIASLPGMKGGLGLT